MADQCIAITRKGTRCVNRALHRSDTCGMHGVPHGEIRCTAILSNGTRCNRRATHRDHYECILHENMRYKREIEIHMRRIIRDRFELTNRLAVHRPENLVELVDRGMELLTETGISYDEVVRILIPRPQTDLALSRIATDNQNIHTTVVNKQTQDGVGILFTFAVPSTQDTLREIRERWSSIFYRRPVNEIIYEDMRRWYNVSMCRQKNDYLYRRLLDHAWAAIKSRPREEEKSLVLRLQQECAESCGTCCEGHISRIINVFVGFIDNMSPPIPIGEILQEKMSRISEIEDLEQRIIEASSVFFELNISAEQAGPWLEALA